VIVEIFHRHASQPRGEAQVKSRVEVTSRRASGVVGGRPGGAGLRGGESRSRSRSAARSRSARNSPPEPCCRPPPPTTTPQARRDVLPTARSHLEASLAAACMADEDLYDTPVRSSNLRTGCTLKLRAWLGEISYRRSQTPASARSGSGSTCGAIRLLLGRHPQSARGPSTSAGLPSDPDDARSRR